MSPENHAEVRRLTVTNHDSVSHFIEITSYAEMVRPRNRRMSSIPRFEKVVRRNGILVRPRGAGLSSATASAGAEADLGGPASWRRKDGSATCNMKPSCAKFIGRGRTIANPAALVAGAVLSGTTGEFWIRSSVYGGSFGQGRRVDHCRVQPQSWRNREQQAQADRRSLPRLSRRAASLRTCLVNSQVELRQHVMTPVEMHLCQRLTSFLLYPNRAGTR